MPLDPGGVWTPGQQQKKKKKKKPPVIGEQHYGGSKVPSGGGKGSGGGGGGAASHPDSLGGSRGPGSVSAPSWVVRRQRLLRNLGFAVTVDGIWGPRSQSAWSAYVTGKRYTGVARYTRQRRFLTERARRNREREFRQQLRAKARTAAEGARRALAESRENIARRQMLDRIERNRFTVGERMTDGPHAALLRNTGVRAESAERVRLALRRKLIEEQNDLIRDQRGAGMMRLSSLLALEERTRESGRKGPRRIAEKLSLENLVDTLFDPEVGRFDATNESHVRILQRFANGHGEKVEEDGIYGPETNSALVRLVERAARQAERLKHREVAEAFYRGGILNAGSPLPAWFPEHAGLDVTPTPGELIRLLNRGDFYASMLWRSLAVESSKPHVQFFAFRDEALRELASTLNPLRDRFTASLFDRGDEQALMDTLIHPAMQHPKAKAQVKALLSSSSFEGFEQQLRYYERWEEYHYLWEQKQRAKEDLPWWGDALGWYDNLGDAFRTGIVAEVMFLTHDPMDYVRNYERDIRKWEARARGEIADSPTALRFAFEVIVDPLALLPFAAIGSVTSRGFLASARVGGRAALAASDIGSLAGSRYAIALRRAAEFMEQAGDAATYARARQATMAAIQRGEAGGLVLGALHAGRVATRLKSESIAVAKRGIEQSLRFSSRPLSAQAAQRLTGRAFDQNPVRDAELQRLIEGNGVRIRALWNEVAPGMVRSLHEERVSLWLHATREENGWSSVGASIFGRLAARVRTMEVHRLAAEYAQKAADAVLVEAAERGEKISDVLDAAAEAAARAEYTRVVRGAGVYRVGVGDGELRGVLKSRVQARIDHLENVVMVELQNLLEEMAERAGFSLFEEGSGLWAFRAGMAQGRLRQAAAATFEQINLRRVENPLAGKLVTSEQKRLAMEEELRIRRAAIYAHYWREIEGGGNVDELIPEMAHRINAVEMEVEQAWRPVKQDGTVLWEDTRETLEVSALYAGHLDEGLEPILADFTAGAEGWSEKIMRLGLPVTGRGAGPLDQELGRMLWYLGSRHGDGPFGVMELDRTADFGVGRFPVPKRDKEMLPKYEELRDRVAMQQVRLQAAYLDAMPRALAREGAYYHALKYAQSKPARVLYRTLQGSLAVWLFATLPLNPGWTVKNLTDNTAKSLIRGHTDPRAYFPDWMVGGARRQLERGASVFDNGLNDLIRAVRVFDNMFQTNAAGTLTRLRDTVWDHTTDVLNRLFRVHGIEVPETVIDQQRFVKSVYEGPDELRLLNSDLDALTALHARGRIDDATFARIEKHRRLTPEEMEQAILDRNRLRKFADLMWDVMGSKPENYSRRVVYRDTFYKTRERLVAQGVPLGEAERRAYLEAMAEVEKVLFDYSKISNMEDNLRLLFPFIQFWRKNTSFWLTSAVEKPWLPVAIGRFEQYRQEAHEDWPEWMRRYFHVKEFSDVAARVPGLEWLVSATGLDQVMYDPLNFFSWAPIYRTFKAENPYLSPDKQGWSFVAPFVDAIEQFGLGINPIFRKPLETVGAVNERAWRAVFPQTTLAAALTRKFLGDWFADRVIDLDSLFADPILGTINAFKEVMGGNGRLPSERYGEMFDTIVRQEMMNQIARGEPANREAAERKVRDFFLLQSVVSAFTAIYVRRMTPEDFYLSQLQFQLSNGRDYNTLSDRDKELLKLWRLHRTDIAAWQEYVELLPLVRAYYSQPDYAAKERFKLEHPELLPHVEPAWRGAPFSIGYINTARLVAETETAMELFDLAETLDLSFDTTSLASSYLVTPELEDFWRKNDTPGERRAKMLRGQYLAHLAQLGESYFAIPEDDYDAKRGFLAEHPELERFWRMENDDADDYKLIVQTALADLRERYFEFAKAGDWDSANAFLGAFPFIFDSFEGMKYVEDRETGRPKGGARGRSQHARDYMRAKRWLDYFFALPESMRDEWLNGGSEGAQIVRWYFSKYASSRGGSRGGMTQHARDYLAAKSWLDHYFSLPKSERGAWLHGPSRGAEIVLAYFKRYGSFNRMQRKFERVAPKLMQTHNAELRRRLRFWQRYFNLTPDQRPGFVSRHAEDYGIFVYGSLGDRERHQREMEWMRKSFVAGMSERSAMYLYVKPLLDFFFALKTAEEKRLFLRANPEVQEYLDDFSRKSATGSKRLDNLIERYFRLPDDSQARSLFLREHPEVQDYFDERSTPAERAMRNLLEVYFEIDNTDDRERFLQRHPEIQDYFDRRQAEKSNEKRQLEAFDEADPRLRAFLELAEQTVGAEGDQMRRRLGLTRVRNAEVGLELQTRR